MRSRRLLTLILAASFLSPACRTAAGPALPEPGPAPQYGPARELARILDPRIDESSGLTASVRYRDAFWTHNDSGDSARVFLIDRRGRTLGVVRLEGVTAFDWEDIASYRAAGEGWILVADVGDNSRRRETGVLHLLREPVIRVPGEGEEAPILEVEPDLEIRFRYEDGPRDCEAVAVDATESAIYLLSKELVACRVYSLPVPPPGSAGPHVARFVAEIRLPYPNAMDISPDGRRAVVLTYGDAHEFTRAEGEPWARAFSRAPRVIKAPVRPQGEAICYGPDGRTLYLTSENAHQPLWEIPVVE
ncbi:MAG: hypothetical protein JXP48_12170 [Acidobacteria bacterium]|nr:hypothetical protein [Acidobacteriota bacterium]